MARMFLQSLAEKSFKRVQDFLSKDKRKKNLKVLTVGFPCQLLHHLWLELAV